MSPIKTVPAALLCILFLSTPVLQTSAIAGGLMPPIHCGSDHPTGSYKQECEDIAWVNPNQFGVVCRYSKEFPAYSQDIMTCFQVTQCHWKLAVYKGRLVCEGTTHRPPEELR